MSNWYKKITASAKDDKENRKEFFIDALEKAQDKAAIGGDLSIEIVQDLIDKLNGKHGYNSLFPEKLKEKILGMLDEANIIKKDSPDRFRAMLDDVIMELS